MSKNPPHPDWNAINNSFSLAILQADRLGEILSDLGHDPIQRCRSGYRGACPIHGGHSECFALRTDGERVPITWKCFSNHCEEKYKPSLIGLVRGILSEQQGHTVGMRETVDFLRPYVGDISISGSSPRLRPEPEPPPKLLKLSRQQVRMSLDIPSRYFLERGFDREVLDEFDVGESAKLKRAVIPLYDDQGSICIGYAARSIRPHCEQCRKHHEGPECRYGQGKWRMPAGFPSSSYLFNFARAKTTEATFVFVTEGPGDVLRLAEAGYVAVALLGSEPSVEQVRKLAELGKEVWIAFDNDEAGEKARSLLLKRVRDAGIRLPTFSFSVPQPHQDIGDCPADELRKAIEWSDEDRKDWPF